MPPMSLTTTSYEWGDNASHPVEEEPLNDTKAAVTTEPSATIQKAQKQKKRSRSVTFDKKIDIQEVQHVRDMTEEDINTMWYTTEDFALIKKSMVVTIRLMMASKPISRDQCTRGLEFRTPTGAKQRKKNKLDALTAVWNEQVSQWNDNKTDEFAISFVYQQQTSKCREQALKFGLHDEKAANKIREEDALEESRLSFEDSVVSISLDDDNNNSEGIRPLVKVSSPAAA